MSILRIWYGECPLPDVFIIYFYKVSVSVLLSKGENGNKVDIDHP